jgi:hypothetical protein
MPGNKRVFPSPWDGFPFALVTGLFLLLAILNWDYANKFFQPLPGHSDDQYYLGPLLFLVAFLFAFASSVFLYLLRRVCSQTGGPSGWDWVQVIGNGALFVVCLLLALAFILMGPAAITMREQMATVPNAQPADAH